MTARFPLLIPTTFALLLLNARVHADVMGTDDAPWTDHDVAECWPVEDDLPDTKPDEFFVSETGLVEEFEPKEVVEPEQEETPDLSTVPLSSEVTIEDDTVWIQPYPPPVDNPEPSSMILAGIGATVLGGRAWLRSRRKDEVEG